MQTCLYLSDVSPFCRGSSICQRWVTIVNPLARRMVPEVSEKLLPQLALGFGDKRLALHITDGIKWVTDAEEGTYDAIIVDSSDPVGPAEVLFEEVCVPKSGLSSALTTLGPCPESLRFPLSSGGPRS